MPPDLTTRRATNPVVARNRLARARVARYLPDLSRWRSTSIRLRAAGSSRHWTAAEAAGAASELAALAREITLARQAFVAEMGDIADTPAVVDFLAALDSMRQ